VTQIATYSNTMLQPVRNPDEARISNVNLPASVTYAAGTVLGEVTASPGTYKAYATGNSDGSQNAALILADDVKTDSSGNVFIGGQTTGSYSVGPSKTARAYRSGEFDTRDLVGLDAGAVTKLGRLVEGTVSAGILRMI
jgi:hypothetical protein